MRPSRKKCGKCEDRCCVVWSLPLTFHVNGMCPTSKEEERLGAEGDTTMPTVQKRALPDRMRYLVSNPDETIARLKEIDRRAAGDKTTSETVLLTLRMDEKVRPRFEQLFERNQNGEGIEELLLNSANRQTLALLESLAGERTFSRDRDFEPLPYMHQAIVRLDRSVLLEWLSGVDRSLLSQVTPETRYGIPEVQLPQANLTGNATTSHAATAATAGAAPGNPHWLAQSRIDELHALNHLGRGEVIGVLDSGVHSHHSKLAGKIAEHVEYDGNGLDVTINPLEDKGCHGTKVSALLVGGARHESVAPEATVAVARVLEGPVRHESGTIAQIARGFNWLASARQRHPISVANVSIDFVAQDPNLPALQALMSQLESFGVKPIIPVGNRGPGTRTQLNGVGLSVGAIDQGGNVCSFSGDRPDIVAPGVGIPCCQPPLPALGGQPTSIYHGTSLAVAFVAGSLAVLRSATKRSIDDCVNAVLLAAKLNSRIGTADARRGWGLLDAKRAYDILVSTPGPIPAP